METCTHTNSNSNRRIRAHPSNASIPRIIIIYTFIVHMKIHYFSRRKFSDHHVGCYMYKYLIYRCLFHIVVFLFLSLATEQMQNTHTHTQKAISQQEKFRFNAKTTNNGGYNHYSRKKKKKLAPLTLPDVNSQRYTLFVYTNKYTAWQCLLCKYALWLYE